VKRIVLAVAALALLGPFALPVQAEPVPRTVRWVCELEGGEEVTFVTAAERARDGIVQANSTAGQVFADLFGEDCDVQ
jgi:hypothetical protein